MQIPCICCGPRDESEFVCGGTSHIGRPDLDASDEDWGRYLFFRENPKGVHLERWRHVQGCGLWFNLARDTVTHEVKAVYAMSDAPPAGTATSGAAPATSGAAPAASGAAPAASGAAPATSGAAPAATGGSSA